MSKKMTSVIPYILLFWGCWQGAKSDMLSWQELDSRPIPVWYDQAKIGVLIIWGLTSNTGYGDLHFQRKLEGGSPEHVQFMRKHFGPRYKYADLAPLFKAEFFNATYWAELFFKSGVKYVDFNSKHCDGFALFPSNSSFNWNSVDIGPNIDLVGELSKAVRKKALKFGIQYCSVEPFHPMYKDDQNDPDKKRNNYVLTKVIPELKQQVLTYEPSTITMWDDYHVDTYLTSREFLSWLINDSPVRHEVVVDDRLGKNCHCTHGDTYFTKCAGKDHKWYKQLNIDAKSYIYRKNMKYDEFLTINQILADIVETVAEGGNILLNIAATDTGIIPPIHEERLLQVGEWLKINGEAIYKTSPWIYQRDTINQKVWYTSVKKAHAYDPRHPLTPVTSADFKNIEALYAIILEWPKDSKITLAPMFTCLTCEKKTVIQLLGNEDKNLEWTSVDQTVTIKLPNFLGVKSKYAWALRFKPQSR